MGLYEDRLKKVGGKAAYEWHSKGIALSKLGRYEEAIECYDKALKIDPQYADAWYNKGYALSKLGRYEKAIECYDRALEIDPKNADLRHNKRIAEGELGEQEKLKSSAIFTPKPTGTSTFPPELEERHNKRIAEGEVGEQEKLKSPAEFTPKPTGTSTFPVELEELYIEAELIGSGGFGRIFKARRKSDGKTVAVKVPIALDASTGKSFLREIKAWQNLKHENIVELYDMNIMPIPYFEMEYADNRSLEELKKPVDVETSGKIVFDIAEGLRYAHSKGIIHRDLKPQNVLLARDLTSKITDWGLSKLMAKGKTSSRYGFSPLYATPEQLSPKKFGVPDERTDIYQLGVVFYELATGKLPFEGDDITEIISQIITEEPEAPSTINPDAENVDHIILKCLEKKKEERYQSIKELQEELGGSLKEEYEKSLKNSASEQNMKRSAYYCCELFMVHAKLNETPEALKYCLDMRNYASGEAREEVERVADELKFRVKDGIEIGEEFLDKARIIAHQVKMGRG